MRRFIFVFGYYLAAGAFRFRGGRGLLNRPLEPEYLREIGAI